MIIHRLVSLCLILALCPAAAGQPGSAELAGTWEQPDYKIRLTLSSDGSFRLEQPQGISQGRYQTQGNLLQLQDGATMAVAQFQVAGLDPVSLTLRDGHGNTLTFRRPPAVVSPTGDAGGAVLATRNGLNLTRANVDIAVGLVQFIIGQSITPEETQAMVDRSVVEFQIDPAEFTRQIEQLTQAVRVLQRLTDPYQIGLGRQQLFAELHLATRAVPESDRPLLVRTLHRYIRVVALDEANRLVLTDRDVEGMLQYLAFSSQLAGQPVDMNPALQREMAAAMVAQFPSMNLEQKQMLCMGSILWMVMETNWNRLTPAQRQQMQQSYAARQTTGSAAPARPAGPADPTRSMAEMQARQNMMRMMNDMNLQSHATSMNIIENMGGTGNYWQVVDKPYWQY